MIYTKKKFGLELKNKILKKIDYKDLSKWAFEIYRDHGLELENDLDYFVLKLIAMEEGPEFFLSEEDLRVLIEELLKE